MPYLDLDADFRPYYEIHDHTDAWTKPETILFVHGFTENCSAWRAWIPHLSRYYRLLTVDTRGFGKSGAVAADSRLTTELFVDDLVRIINHLVGAPVHVVTAKSGGTIVVRLAATRPDLVKSIVLASVTLTAPGSPDWLAQMEQYGVRGWARRTMAARLGREASPGCIDWWVDMMGATALSTARAYLGWVTTTEGYKDLPGIKCPALIISTRPAETPNGVPGRLTSAAMLKELPQAELLVLDVDGYHAAGAHPDACAQATFRFLAGQGDPHRPKADPDRHIAPQ
jgi:pimeloyl-ACP methyl ester carboxylesterase